ncbi:MAG: hypothetical protein D6682_05470 [Zetaproteobacteria bacterium]|nr:MAG: hypothetical protein D6682_05470 [Zetaproteobacteria bacterium]
MAASILLVLLSFALMGVGWRLRHRPRWHVPIMAAVMLFDLLLFPLWLYRTHDWGRRLIDEGDILSFGVWAHWGLVLMLLILYALQAALGRAILRGDAGQRQPHARQAIGILLVRLAAFVSGAMLIVPTPT